MAFPNSEKAFAFSWCAGYSLASLQDSGWYAREEGALRVCFITTQVYRIYIVVDEDGLHYWPFEFEDGMWRKLHKHLWVVGEPRAEDFVSESALWDALCFQMVKQFRSSVESFYGDPPTHEEVQARLGSGLQVSVLDTLRYTWHTVYVQEDEEWDGAIEVLCADGSLLIPYRGEHLLASRLLTEYATFYPDSYLQSATNKVSKLFDNIFSAVRNLHWSNVRLFIESKGGHA